MLTNSLILAFSQDHEIKFLLEVIWPGFAIPSLQCGAKDSYHCEIENEFVPKIDLIRALCILSRKSR